MSKSHVKYICANCGFESLKWVGRCPSCEEWNTFSEEIVEKKKAVSKRITEAIEFSPLNKIVDENEERLKTNINEFDRVLGNGLMPGSVVLVGGDPGIGKSTLVMQAAVSLNKQVLYISGEESIRQLTLRAKRLKLDSKSVLLFAETNMDLILSAIAKAEPAVVIVDSIQTVYKTELDNSPGTITQIRETTAELIHIAKTKNIAVIIVGHVTKEGYIAGPKVLEHIVDTVLQFEGERNHSYRILRAQKNRFGSTNEIGIFEMFENGLAEVKNPSEIFLNDREIQATGSVVTASIEGSRPVLFEVQALVTPTHYGNPQRVATGFDYRRLSILLAVLEKRANFRLGSQNVFVNMAGGLKIDEPACDLAVCCAIASSLSNVSILGNKLIIGEVGLGGEIRGVGHVEKRIQEAKKLGFTEIILPAINIKSIKTDTGVKLTPVKSISEAITQALAN